MLDLLTILKQGSTYDEALTEVYGFDIDGLNARWRATLTSSVVADQSAGLHPALIAVLAMLATGLTLGGVATMKKRVGRRSCGASTMWDKP